MGGVHALVQCVHPSAHRAAALPRQGADFDSVARVYFTQFHLHRQLLEEQVCAHASRRKLPRRTYLPVHACVRA